MERRANATYCEDLIRRFDEDRYLGTVFAPAAARPHLFAVYAFNFEIARTAESVSQPMAGHIRLQWWRETLDGIYAGAVREQPVAQTLARAVGKHDLPRALFDAAIDAREADLEETPFADLAAMEAYADATSGNVMRLAARVLGAGEAIDAAARDVGIAYALIGLVRAQPFLARAVIPPEGTDAVIRRAVERVRAMPHVARRYLPALLPASLVRLYVRAVQGNRAVSRFQKQKRMLAAMLRGRL